VAEAAAAGAAAAADFQASSERARGFAVTRPFIVTAGVRLPPLLAVITVNSIETGEPCCTPCCYPRQPMDETSAESLAAYHRSNFQH
jgi:hypothetical protein